VLGGLIVLLARSRPVAVFGAWLAAISGAWFVVGGPVSTMWTADHLPAAGQAVGGTVARAVEQVGFFGGLGAVIIFFAALAMGRFTVVGIREVEDKAAYEQEQYEQAGQAHEDAATMAASGTERFSLHPEVPDDRPTVS
jgi:hypothetical protein